MVLIHTLGTNCLVHVRLATFEKCFVRSLNLIGRQRTRSAFCVDQWRSVIYVTCIVNNSQNKFSAKIIQRDLIGVFQMRRGKRT